MHTYVLGAYPAFLALVRGNLESAEDYHTYILRNIRINFLGTYAAFLVHTNSD